MNSLKKVQVLLYDSTTYLFLYNFSRLYRFYYQVILSSFIRIEGIISYLLLDRGIEISTQTQGVVWSDRGVCHGRRVTTFTHMSFPPNDLTFVESPRNGSTVMENSTLWGVNLHTPGSLEPMKHWQLSHVTESYCVFSFRAFRLWAVYFWCSCLYC